MKEYTKDFLVAESDSAKYMGSGSLEVLATPACIAMAENTCLLLSEEIIAQEETTVGTFIEFNHLKPSSIGQNIRVSAILLEKSGNKQLFKFSIYHENDLIGYGQHKRYVVNKEKFMKNIFA